MASSNDADTSYFTKKVRAFGAPQNAVSRLCPNEERYVPDRVCGDIPFHLYRAAFGKPERYLEFLKKLEQSSSRHDFLFWLFDIIAGGRRLSNESTHSITAEDLDAMLGDNKVFSYLPKITKHALNTYDSTTGSTLSSYLMNTYPIIFKAHLWKGHPNPVFSTMPNTPELREYRENALSKFKKQLMYVANHDEYFCIDPMEGLTLNDLPASPVPVTYEKPRPAKAKKQPFFSFLNYFYGLLAFTGKIPESDDCILVEKDPYKRLQIESFMKRKINDMKLIRIREDDIQKLYDIDSLVVVEIDAPAADISINETESTDEGYQTPKHIYKRAKLLCNIRPLNKDSVWVLFVDYGEVGLVLMRDLYAYNFGLHAPEHLTTVVQEKKLPSNLVKNDLLVFNFFKKIYVFVGHPYENFEHTPDPRGELDTDTESVNFGSGTVDDWEDEPGEPRGNGNASEEMVVDDGEETVYGIQNDWTNMFTDDEDA